MLYIKGMVSFRPDQVISIMFTLLICLQAGILAERYANFLKLKNNDTRFETLIDTKTLSMPMTHCFSACEAIEECIYVSYHSDHQLCHLHEINKTVVTSPGWNIYYKSLDEDGKTEMDLKKNATAYQSSTHPGYFADKALDGNTDGYIYGGYCSHTANHYSYWIMQFGISGVVEKVEIYMRSINIVEGRNSDRVVKIAQTFDDAVNDVGIECGRYFGETTDVITIQCEGPIFGKFLRISHVKDNVMETCEVFVYSP